MRAKAQLKRLAAKVGIQGYCRCGVIGEGDRWVNVCSDDPEPDPVCSECGRPVRIMRLNITREIYDLV